jgi:hypothetical protein
MLTALGLFCRRARFATISYDACSGFNGVVESPFH